LTGTLPWAHLRGLQNLDKVRDMKLQYNNEKLVRGMPDAFLQVPCFLVFLVDAFLILFLLLLVAESHSVAAL